MKVVEVVEEIFRLGHQLQVYLSRCEARIGHLQVRVEFGVRNASLEVWRCCEVWLGGASKLIMISAMAGRGRSPFPSFRAQRAGPGEMTASYLRAPKRCFCSVEAG